MQARPEQARAKGLTNETFNTEAQKRIEQYIDSYFSTHAPPRSFGIMNNTEGTAGSRDLAKEAARQCALGKPAACN